MPGIALPNILETKIAHKNLNSLSTNAVLACSFISLKSTLHIPLDFHYITIINFVYSLSSDSTLI